MPDIVTAVPDVLTCWRKLPLSRSHSRSLSLPSPFATLWLTSCQAELQRERARERHSRLSKAPEVLTYSRNRHRLAGYLPLPCPPIPLLTPPISAANVNVRGCSFCFRFWGNFVPLCVVKCLDWAARAWRHLSSSSSSTANLNIKAKLRTGYCYSLWILLPSLLPFIWIE